MAVLEYQTNVDMLILKSQQNTEIVQNIFQSKTFLSRVHRSDKLLSWVYYMIIHVVAIMNYSHHKYIFYT